MSSMKKTAIKPWQHHAAESLCRVGETAGLAAVYIGAAWACRRLFCPDLKVGNKQESEPEQQVIKENNCIENGNAVTPAKLNDVIGLDEVKAEINEKLIQPFLRPELFERFQLKNRNAGVILFGPPGNGKTYIAQAIAGEVDAKFFGVNPSEVKSKWVGQTEKNIQKLFDDAKRYPKSVIFFDEADALLSRAGNQKIGAVTQFLSASDGLTKTKNCLLLLAATNRPWALDRAVTRPGRLGCHIYVPPPDLRARQAILALNLHAVPVADELNLAEVANNTERYSGADLVELCDRAKRAAKNRQVKTGQDEVVSKADLAEAIGKIRPSVSSTQLKQFEAWRKDRQRLSEIDDDEE